MKYWFFPIFGIVGVAILLWLGFWQLQRLEWKTNLLGEIEARMSQDPVLLEDGYAPGDDNYRRVMFEGQLTGPAAHFLTSERNTGPGYKVVAAVRSGDRTVMIDLGFVPIDQKPAFETLTGDVRVIGNLYWPNEVDPGYTPDPDLEKNIFFARDLQNMPAFLDAEPLLIVATDVEPNLGTVPQRVAHNLPNDHLQYAITWFLLALVWAGMTIYAVIRQRRETAAN